MEFTLLEKMSPLSRLNFRLITACAKTYNFVSSINNFKESTMTTSEYAQKIVELIDDRPSRIDLDKLLDEIAVRAKIAEARRAGREGRWLEFYPS
jgi:hypothetical protein